MKTQQIRNSLTLLLTAFIWGVAFVAQSVGMDYVEPFTFNCVRSLIGGVVLVPCIFLLDKLSPQRNQDYLALDLSGQKENQKKLIKGGVWCGIVICVASNLQQFGISYTTVGKAGFITALYIVIVPILGLFFRKKCSPAVWIGVVLAVFGLYFLCMTEGFSVQLGDFLVFLCALAFSVHIMVIDHFTQLVDGVKMSCIQFLVCGVISGVCMFLFENPSMSNILAAWQPILYAGVLSCGVAYTLQIVGQKGMNPTVASLILSLESVISVLAGLVLLGQKLSGREVAGCAFMFAAIVLAQLPSRSKSEKAVGE
ncbi:MAG: DMT family transporter [Lachnospiraceae bacterium]|jgi:drug/metabolite transporter (DMT)-like permease|nr:DMT family transporter [Lachnospiraceae bacterium]